MGPLLIGLVLGLAIGFALGRRHAGDRVPSPAAIGPLAPRPAAPGVGAGPGPLGAPNKQGRKAGLTEDDFRPADDILERMRQAWEQSAERGLDEVQPIPLPVPEPEPEPEPTVEGVGPLDPALDDTMRRVFERLEATRAEKGADTMADAPEEPAPAAAPGAGTVTEGLADLEADGYTDDLRFSHGQVTCANCGAVHGTDGVEVDRVLRYEGESDPADEAIVFGLRCPGCGAKGSLVSAYGIGADPELAEAFVYWADKARHR